MVGGKSSELYTFTVLPLIPTKSEVSIKLIALSPRFRPTTFDLSGDMVTLQLSSRDDPLFDGINRELLFEEEITSRDDLLSFGADSDFLSHSAAYLVAKDSESELFAGFLEVNLPTNKDTNNNGIPDFFEEGLALASSTSSGGYWDDILEDFGNVDATWSRNANTPTGQVAISMKNPEGVGTFLEFQSEFELITYAGNLDYQKTDNQIAGPVSLELVNNVGLDLENELNGIVTFEISNSDHLELSAGKLEGDNQLSRPFTSLTHVWREDSRYFGVLEIDLSQSSNKEGFSSYILLIEDLSDGDGDGIPRFSDPTETVDKPNIELTRNENGNIILEWDDSKFNLYSSTTIDGEFTNTGSTSPTSITPSEDKKFFLIKAKP